MQDTNPFNPDGMSLEDLIAMRQRIDEALAARRQTLAEQLAKLGEITEAKPRRQSKKSAAA